MTWSDESDWEECDDDEADCSHEEYDVDWEGRATCIYCNDNWWLTTEQLTAHHEAEAQYAAEYDRMQRREGSRVYRTIDWGVALARRVLAKFKTPRRVGSAVTDDVPF